MFAFIETSCPCQPTMKNCDFPFSISTLFFKAANRATLRSLQPTSSRTNDSQKICGTQEYACCTGAVISPIQLYAHISVYIAHYTQICNSLQWSLLSRAWRFIRIVVAAVVQRDNGEFTEKIRARLLVGIFNIEMRHWITSVNRRIYTTRNMLCVRSPHADRQPRWIPLLNAGFG